MSYMNPFFLEDLLPHNTGMFSSAFAPAAWIRTAHRADTVAIISIFGISADFPYVSYRQGFTTICKIQMKSASRNSLHLIDN